jgi:predicted PurR-regulated permease PerM
MMTGPSTASERKADLAFVRRIFIVVGIGALIAAVWALTDILILLFGAILFAVMVHTIAAPLQVRLAMGPRLAISVAGGGMLALLVGAGFYFGPELAQEMRSVAAALPEAANRAAGYLQLGNMTGLMRDGGAASALGGLATRVIAWSTTIAGALASLLLIVFGGIYLAINPSLYRDGFVKWVPPAVQSNVEATLDDAGQALKRWLKGQALAGQACAVYPMSEFAERYRTAQPR